MRNKVTQKELSKILNVSISTVSKALKDSPEISDETRRRVKELAKMNNYLPNAMALNLKNNSSKTIGVIIPAILPQFFSKVLYGIETRASSMGYKVIVCISNDSTAKEAEGINTLIAHHVDGIIISLARETQLLGEYSHFDKISRYDVPLVMFDRVTDRITCDKVQIDDCQQATKATLELFDSGCEQVAYISGISDTSVDNERRKGYELASNSRKRRELIYSISPADTCGKEILSFLKNNKVDGVLASDELTAIVIMKVALTHGYNIPDNLAVIGFSNGTMGEHFITPLSSVDQKEVDQGHRAVDMIIKRIEGSHEEYPLELKLNTSVIHRSSTRPPVVKNTV